jgi:hypothetical protein
MDRIAWAKVADAVERLKERKELQAPPEQQHDWVLVDKPRTAAEST